MKLLLSFFISTLFFTGTPTWLTDFSKAKTEATQSHKYIIVNFSGSDWCGPCIRMHKTIFESDAFAGFADQNLTLVKADFPRLKKHKLTKEQEKQNEKLAMQYNPEGKFPYTVLLNVDGKVLKAWEGCPDETPEDFVAELNAAAHARK